MKRLFLLASLVGVLFPEAKAQSASGYKVITVVESIVPGGVGRSRIIDEGSEVNVDDMSTERTNGKDSKQGKVRRSDMKVDNFTETKLLNFYSLVGINFQNIASNDAIIAAKLDQLTSQGWELKFVTSGVERDAGDKDRSGIFITRFIFHK